MPYPVFSPSLWVSLVAKPHLLSPCSLGVPCALGRWCLLGCVVYIGNSEAGKQPSFHTYKCCQRWDGIFAWACFQALVESHQHLDFSLKNGVGPSPPPRKYLSFFYFSFSMVMKFLV